MNTLKYSLYSIGIIGIAFAVYGIFSGSELSTILSGLVCGASLIFGAREVQANTSKEDCSQD